MSNADQIPPKGYRYDKEISDSRTAGFCDISGEQWYAKRSDLHPSVKQGQKKVQK